MKNLKKLAAAAAVAMLATQPVIAASNPASKLSVSKSVRASSAAGKSKQEEGISTGLIVAGVIAAAVVVYLVVDGDDSN